MVWLFDYTAPTFIVLLLFTTFYFLRPVVITKSNRYFLTALIFEILGFAMTFISSYVDNYYADYNMGFLTFVNSAYYLLYMARYLLLTLYIASLVQVRIRKDIFFNIVLFFIFAVCILVLVNPITHYIYTVTPTEAFVPGKYLNFIYYANLSTLLVDIYLLVRKFKKLDIKIKISVIFCIIILFGCFVTDLYYMDYLITDMFFLLVLLIFFLTFENPDIYRDKMTNIFNVEAFRESMKDNFYYDYDFKIFGFVIKNFQETRQIYGMKLINQVLKEIGDYLIINFSNINFFYLQNGKFTVVYNNNIQIKDIEKQIKLRFKQNWDVPNGTSVQLNIVLVTIDDKMQFKSFDELQACSELALYKAYKSSLSHVLIDNDTINQIEKNKDISKALINALNTNTLEVYLQPIIDSESRQIVAAEALVRLKDEKLGIIPPDSFIEMSEQNGYINELTKQVLNKVCMFLHDEGIYNCHLKWINVNLSPLQCLDPKLIANVNNIVKKHNIDPAFIHLEITEDCMINKEILKNQMQGLKESGYYVSLDDFGSGFSNLSLISALPFNNIKLDMGIVWAHFENQDIMLPGLVSIFRKKGLSVTAEGVETKEMADELAKMGCNYLQGYYMSCPIPMDEFVALKQSNPKY